MSFLFTPIQLFLSYVYLTYLLDWCFNSPAKPFFFERLRSKPVHHFCGRETVQLHLSYSYFFTAVLFSLTIIRVKLSNELRRGPALKLWMADSQYWASASSFWWCPLPSPLLPSASPVPAESPCKQSLQHSGKASFSDHVVLVGWAALPATRSSSLWKHAD